MSNLPKWMLIDARSLKSRNDSAKYDLMWLYFATYIIKSRHNYRIQGQFSRYICWAGSVARQSPWMSKDRVARWLESFWTSKDRVARRLASRFECRKIKRLGGSPVVFALLKWRNSDSKDQIKLLSLCLPTNDFLANCEFSCRHFVYFTIARLSLIILWIRVQDCASLGTSSPLGQKIFTLTN